MSPSRGSANFDATFYHLDLDLHFDTQTITGRVRADGTVKGSPLSELVLDFLSPVAPPDIEVDSVRMSSGATVGFSHTNDILRIGLPRSFGIGERVSVEVFYSGRPRDMEAFQFGRVLSSGMQYAWSLSEPYGARSWWPNKDHPTDKADSVRVTVTVPQGMRVGSNGLLRAETPDAGTVTYDWISRYPIATYLVSVAAAPYEVIEQRYIRPDSLAQRYGALDMPVLHYQYPGSNMVPVQGSFRGWAHVTTALAVLEYWFGPYPFSREKYGHAQFTWGGGMEHQTMSSMAGNGIDLIVHELAHAWYGDAITMRTWPHLWLNEGFANYSEILFLESGGPVYQQELQKALKDQVLYARRAPGTLVVADTASEANLFDFNRVYSKGGHVLHMLRGVIGTEKFRTLLQRYAADPALRYGTATTADFQRVAEEVSGTDLDYFFRQWVTEGTGYPRYQMHWNSRPGEAGYEVVVQLRQNQTSPASNIEAFKMPVQLVVVTSSGIHRFTVFNDQRVQDFILDVPGEPTDVVFDPDLYLLRDDVVPSLHQDSLPFPTGESRLGEIFPNPVSSVVNVDVVLTRSGTVKLDLFDALGRRMQTAYEGPQMAGTHTYRVDLSRLPAGRYFLHLVTDDGQDTEALTVVH